MDINWRMAPTPASDDAVCRALADRLDKRRGRYRRPYNEVFCGARFELACSWVLGVHDAVEAHLRRERPTKEDLEYDVIAGGVKIDFKSSWQDPYGTNSLLVKPESLRPDVAYVYGILMTGLPRSYKFKDERPTGLNFAIVGWTMGDRSLFIPGRHAGTEHLLRCERHVLRPFDQLLIPIQVQREQMRQLPTECAPAPLPTECNHA